MKHKKVWVTDAKGLILVILGVFIGLSVKYQAVWLIFLLMVIACLFDEFVGWEESKFR